MTAQPPREIELKLELDRADVSRMRALLGARLNSEPRTARLTSIYYDTSARDLEAAGVTLRIRLDADKAPIQTVKRTRGSASALFDRDEWETVVPSREPDLAAFAATPAGADLVSPNLDLAPVFETVVDRSVWQVTRKNSRIEVALDEGRVTTGRRSQDLAELELELKAGTPRDLFRLVHALGAVGSLRPGVLSKSERGYRLMCRKPDRASKAEPLRLDKHTTTAAAFQAIVHACLRHFGLNAPLVVGRRMPDALHQTRVALRRLRSALSLFKDVVADPTYAKLKAELQGISQALGEARNLDVYLAKDLRPEGEQAMGQAGAQAFLDEMERRRGAAYDRVIAQLQSPTFQSLLLRLLEWTEAGPWTSDLDALRSSLRDRPVRRFAARVLKKRHRRVSHRGRHLATLDPQVRHRVRIEAKKLRYASEFFAGLAHRPKARDRHGRYVAVLEELQDALGELNDIQTGHEIAVSFVEEARDHGGVAAEELFAASELSGRQEARTEALLEAAEAAHARLVDAKRFWAAWLD